MVMHKVVKLDKLGGREVGAVARSVQAFTNLIEVIEGQIVEFKIFQFKLFDIEAIKAGVVEKILAERDAFLGDYLREKIVQIDGLFLDSENGLIEKIVADFVMDELFGKEFVGDFTLENLLVCLG